MTVAIEISFPTGFIHATPWRSHVNEGRVEWPLSPWRLLRALISVWKMKCPELTDEEVMSLITCLADPPDIYLAPKIDSSIRTYIPSENHKSGQKKPDQDLMVDAFGAVDPSSTAIAYKWDVELNDRQVQTLEVLTQNLTYLGRSESICLAKIIQDDTKINTFDWKQAKNLTDGTGSRVLVPNSGINLSLLSESVDQMRKSKRLDPVGARWMVYKVNDFVPNKKAEPKREPKIKVLCFSLYSPARPSIHEAVLVSDSFRSLALNRLGDSGTKPISHNIIGKDGEDMPLRGNKHAYWIALDEDNDKLVDKLYVWIPSSISLAEAVAIAKIDHFRIRMKGGNSNRIESLLIGMGSKKQIFPQNLIGPSRKWNSLLPFLPQRYNKKESPLKFITDCVKRELDSREIDSVGLKVSMIPGPWGAFKTYRIKETASKRRPPFSLSLEFEKEVEGPILIGSLSHFGMGLFGHSDRNFGVDVMN